MAVVETAELSSYVVGLAGAARAAQSILSSGADPMTISEYRFLANITSEVNTTSDTDVKLKIWRLDITEKITIQLRREWGIEIECKIIPSVNI